MKKSIKDFDIKGKRVIIRCDFNVPIKDNKILDDTRIKNSLKTIKYACDNGAKVILMSHLGKVKSEVDKVSNSLLLVADRLSKLLNMKVKFSSETRGKLLESLVSSLQSGEILLVENTRFEDLNGKRESSCDISLSKYWASLGDIFINDAYGTCHRNHASNVGISKYLDSGVGFLVLDELTKIDNFMNDNSSPFVVIMGGAKVSDKIGVIENLITKCDKLLLGGGMCFTFLYAKGINVGKSLVDVDSVSFAKKMIDNYGDKIVLPVDIVCNDGTFNVNSLHNDSCGYDIGPNSVILFTNILKSAKRCFINGTMGVYEDSKYANGTKGIYEALKKYNVKCLVGGGDTASSVNNLGYANVFYHVSTGGGATLEYLSGKGLVALDSISDV